MNAGAFPGTAQGFRRVDCSGISAFAEVTGDTSVFYVPGFVHVLPAAAAPAVVRHLHSENCATPGEASIAGRAALCLAREASRVHRESDDLPRSASHLECLTVFVNDNCNLDCGYCYSRRKTSAPPAPSAAAIRAASRLVAAHCAEHGQWMTLALHGGGEPTLDPEYLDEVLRLVGHEAERTGVRLRTYIATNGVMSEARARWLASRFGLIGVSCDGPADIQDRHRPRRGGGGSASRVERTLAALSQCGRPFHIRATLTRDTMGREREIVNHLAVRYRPAEIRLEPVYLDRSPAATFRPSDAEDFVAGYLSAVDAGLSEGVPVTTSISQPGFVQRRYCNVLRHVLNLVPGDVATGCFLHARADEIAPRGLETGRFDPARGEFVLHEGAFRGLVERCSRVPDECRECVCCHRCTYGCPDHCALDPETAPPETFRCRVSRLLTESLIRRAAARAWTSVAPGRAGRFRDPDTSLEVVVDRAEEVAP